jgi:hypothetical protein
MATSHERTQTHLVAAVEVQLDELSETRRIVVARCLGVSERLEQRVGGKNALLEVSDVTTTTVRVGQVPGGGVRRVDSERVGLGARKVPHGAVN